MMPPPFLIATCEDRLCGRFLCPLQCNPDAPMEPFEVSDPFGLRKAILPIFRGTNEGRLYGMGTSFHIDGWGTLMTAEHVIDFLRAGYDLDPSQTTVFDPVHTDHPLAMLGLGVVFGEVGVPQHAFARITSYLGKAVEHENPMAMFGQGSAYRVGVDLCALRASFHADAEPPATVPVRLDNRWTPRVGEYVLALGYPQLTPNETTPDEHRALLSDGLYGAYGRITEVMPRGRDRTNPGPAFQVEGEWARGMSGGPVFNQAGEVVGVVSRGLDADGASPAIGLAVWVAMVPDIGDWFSTLDAQNPGWRRGYGIMVGEAGRRNLVAVEQQLAVAEQRADELGNGHGVERVVHRLGTDEFLSF